MTWFIIQPISAFNSDAGHGIRSPTAAPPPTSTSSPDAGPTTTTKPNATVKPASSGRTPVIPHERDRRSMSAPPRAVPHNLETMSDAHAQLASAEAELAGVDRALARLDDGTYGRCDVCGEPVDTDADPLAVRCPAHA